MYPHQVSCSFSAMWICLHAQPLMPSVAMTRLVTGQLLKPRLFLACDQPAVTQLLASCDFN